ncbi:MAG: nitrous oxide-stimulated promoter family protein [Oligoflexia bacterium]|nr:nitrous oxide-stimulated promoter family protein [Oligoflexia bacterium]
MGMVPGSPRFEREMQTLEAMTRIYCRENHEQPNDSSCCARCSRFLDYARYRLEKCAFGEDKPTCARCPIHCYTADERAYAKQLMGRAGPRMLFRHPLLALLHSIDGALSAGRIRKWQDRRAALKRG